MQVVRTTNLKTTCKQMVLTTYKWSKPLTSGLQANVLNHLQDVKTTCKLIKPLASGYDHLQASGFNHLLKVLTTSKWF